VLTDKHLAALEKRPQEVIRAALASLDISTRETLLSASSNLRIIWELHA